MKSVEIYKVTLIPQFITNTSQFLDAMILILVVVVNCDNYIDMNEAIKAFHLW